VGFWESHGEGRYLSCVLLGNWVLVGKIVGIEPSYSGETVDPGMNSLVRV